MKRHSEKGMALVITLMMLAIVTFMAVIFLAMSRRERNSVKVTEEQNISRQMADIGSSRAQSDIIATMNKGVEAYLVGKDAAGRIKGTNEMKVAIDNGLIQRAKLHYSLRSSRSYTRAGGFATPGDYRVFDPINASFEKETGAGSGVYTPLAYGGNDYLRAVANLQYDPRVPVWEGDPREPGARMNYYLDLNRNGVPDDNAFKDPREYNVSGGVRFVGDPEWIGILERPDQPHSENNRFIGRFCYLVLPEGKSLDINYIHNLTEGNDDSFPGSTSRYTRNWGVGSWEMNLAAFLVDFHTNVWRPRSTVVYNYDSLGGSPRIAAGTAFRDARGILGYRLSGSRLNLHSPQEIFPQMQSDQSLWRVDYADYQGDGPFVDYNRWYREPNPIRTGLLFDQDIPTKRWFGADQPAKTAEYSDIQRPFVLNTTVGGDFSGFYNRFINATSGRNLTNYDRFGYYRFVGQMGADSTPALRGKIHLNYTNEPGTLSTNLKSWFETNSTFIAGTPSYIQRPDQSSLTNFFLIAADAMLKRSLVTNVFLDEYRVWRTNYTVGGTYFVEPRMNTDVTAERLIANFPVRHDISITNIQIYHRPLSNLTVQAGRPFAYVTNAEYGAAVHRILQLAANIYDGMTNAGPREPYYPSVFRPVFTVTTTNVIISGYEFSPLANQFPADANWHTDAELFRMGPGYYSNRYVWGQAAVVGAKKGWPNFNELSMETYAQIGRKLQLVKSADRRQLIETNQLFTIAISNIYGLELWNSYLKDLNLPVTVAGTVQSQVGLDAGKFGVYTNIYRLTNQFLTHTAPYVVNNWKGRKSSYTERPFSLQPNNPPDMAQSDFRLPIYTNWIILPNADFIGGFLTPFRASNAPAAFIKGLQTPDFILRVTNQFRYMATVQTSDGQRIIDFVTINGLRKDLDLTKAMATQTNVSTVAFGNSNGDAGRFWLTNYMDKANILSPGAATDGHQHQLLTSMGLEEVSEKIWTSYNMTFTADKPKGIRGFQQWLQTLADPPVAPPSDDSTSEGNPGNPSNPGPTPDQSLTWQAPFSPVRTLYFYSRFQANDPLVHYMEEDLRNRYPLEVLAIQPGTVVRNTDFGGKNKQYQPWGEEGSPNDWKMQDPRVYNSDDWQFPIAKLDNPTSPSTYGIPNFHYRFPNIGHLGQIHRGTPWQTVYLKAGLARLTNVVQNNVEHIGFAKWSGSYGTHPANDWKLIGLFTTAMTENAARGLLSVNQTNIAAWSALLSGVQVITNSVPNSEYKLAGNRAVSPRYGVPTSVGQGGPDLLIQPASMQLSNIVAGINRYRAARPLGVFGYMGEILGTPELTIGNLPNGNVVGSPFLNLDGSQFGGSAFTDEAFEAIPQRVMSLLKEDEPRMVIYSFGQTLKPAPRSLATSGDFYNLCLNYQVAGEYATKTIVRVEGELRNTNNPVRTVVESFEQLPPFE